MQTIFYCVDIIEIKNGRFKDGYLDQDKNKSKEDKNKDNTFVCLIKAQLPINF